MAEAADVAWKLAAGQVIIALMMVAVVVIMMAIVALQTATIRRLRRAEARMAHDTRPRPDYALIAAMETEIWGHPFHHAGAPWRCGWTAWCAPGREAEAAEILRAFGVHVTRVTGHPAIPDGEVIVVNPDSGYQPGYGSTSAPLNGATARHLQLGCADPGNAGWPSIIGGRSALKFFPEAAAQPGEHLGSSLACQPSKFPCFAAIPSTAAAAATR